MLQPELWPVPFPAPVTVQVGGMESFGDHYLPTGVWSEQGETEPNKVVAVCCLGRQLSVLTLSTITNPIPTPVTARWVECYHSQGIKNTQLGGWSRARKGRDKKY